MEYFLGQIIRICENNHSNVKYYSKLGQTWLHLEIPHHKNFRDFLQPDFVRKLNLNFFGAHVWTKFVWVRTPCETFSTAAKLGSQSQSSTFIATRCTADAEIILLFEKYLNFTAKFTIDHKTWVRQKLRISVETRVAELFDSATSKIIVPPNLLGFSGSRYNFIAYCRFRERFPVTIFAWLLPFRPSVWYCCIVAFLLCPLVGATSAQFYFCKIFIKISHLFGQSEQVGTIPELLFVFSCIILCVVYSTFIEGSIIAPYSASTFASLQDFVNASYQIIHIRGQSIFKLLYIEGQLEFARLGINLEHQIFMDFTQAQFQNTTREKFIADGNRAGHYSYYTDLTSRDMVVQKLENTVQNFRGDDRMRCFGLDYGGTVPTYFVFPIEFRYHGMRAYQRIVESGLLFDLWVKSESGWTIRKHIVKQKQKLGESNISHDMDIIGLKNLSHFLVFIFLILFSSFIAFTVEKGI
ncbi:hypothetical protein Fcan01_01451 [Folsomia candida]|uniref:Uncharacterized protein n=1 Tax=Folsomia candida TaxID=158441 RepID=A0A226F2B1_FOLCA|nr:hypothetical protein Fcan01_01451 [Folsomia candida]